MNMRDEWTKEASRLAEEIYQAAVIGGMEPATRMAVFGIAFGMSLEVLPAAVRMKAFDEAIVALRKDVEAMQ